MRVLLKSPGVWQAGEQCWCRGCAIIEGKLLRDADLLKRIDQLRTTEQAVEFARSAGGFFAFIRLFPSGDACAVVDCGRSIPLFFCRHSGELTVGDSARTLASRLGEREPDPLAKAEFMLMCCVSGNDTLHPEVKQLRAGEMLLHRAADNEAEIERFFRYRQVREPEHTRAELLDYGRAVISEAVVNLARYADGRTIVVPLSGGMDSTMLLAVLARSGYPRLAAYTYGRPQSSEMRHSRSITAELGVPWHPVEYSTELWRRWFLSEHRRAYYEMADNLCALPHIQDFPAVAELKRSGSLPGDAVIASGISVESFYGSPSQPPHPLQHDVHGVDQARLPGMIIDEKYRLWPGLYSTDEFRRALEQRILASIGDTAFHPHSASCYESWFTHEKMSKFYNNSVRAYEYWGYDWWLPLWDKPVIDFWQQVPAPWRRVREFTAELVSRIYVEAAGRPYRPAEFETPLQRSARLMRHAMQRLPLLRSVYDRMKRNLKYDSDHLGWFGLFGREQFLKLYHPKLSINSLLVREYFGELQALGGEQA